MKITYIAAQGLLFLAACLPAAAQVEVNPDHLSDVSSAPTFASARESKIRVLQEQLEGYKRELRAKSEIVENAWQKAISAAIKDGISAGMQGDEAGPYIEAYWQERKEMDALQATLTPQIEQTRTLIANLTMSAAHSDTAMSPKVKPAHPTGRVLAANNSHEIH